jgi:hypothetical protein
VHAESSTISTLALTFSIVIVAGRACVAKLRDCGTTMCDARVQPAWAGASVTATCCPNAIADNVSPKAAAACDHVRFGLDPVVCVRRIGVSSAGCSLLPVQTYVRDGRFCATRV